MYRCPGGTYGNATGLSTSECSGKCPAGYFCRPATVEHSEEGPNLYNLFLRDENFIRLNNLGILEDQYALVSMNKTHLRPFECGSIVGVRGPCYPTVTGKTSLELATGDRRCELEVTFGNEWTIGDWELLCVFIVVVVVVVVGLCVFMFLLRVSILTKRVLSFSHILHSLSHHSHHYYQPTIGITLEMDGILSYIKKYKI